MRGADNAEWLRPSALLVALETPTLETPTLETPTLETGRHPALDWREFTEQALFLPALASHLRWFARAQLLQASLSIRLAEPPPPIDPPPQ